MKVIFVERKNGSYQGHAYDNYYIHVCHNAVATESAKGSKTEVFKLKASEVEKLNPFTWIDKSLEIHFDKYGRPCYVNVK